MNVDGLVVLLAGCGDTSTLHDVIELFFKFLQLMVVIHTLSHWWWGHKNHFSACKGWMQKQAGCEGCNGHKSRVSRVQRLGVKGAKAGLGTKAGHKARDCTNFVTKGADLATKGAKGMKTGCK